MGGIITFMVIKRDKMKGSKDKFNNRKIDGKSFANVDTGELLENEIGKGSSVLVLDEKNKVLGSNSFHIVDDEVMGHIRKAFNAPDMGRICHLMHMAKGGSNIISDEEGKPYDNETLAIELDYETKRYRQFMARLFCKGILAFSVAVHHRGLVYVISLNPSLSRNRNTITRECMQLFQDLKNGLPDLPEHKMPKFIKNGIFITEHGKEAFSMREVSSIGKEE